MILRVIFAVGGCRDLPCYHKAC